MEVIYTNIGQFLKSYDTLVVYRDQDNVMLSSDWDCSRTTAKHCGKFLDMPAVEIRKRIKSGKFTVVTEIRFGTCVTN